VWFFYKSENSNPYYKEFPYDARSFSQKKTIKYQNIDEVVNELVFLYDEAVQGGFPVGQALFLQHGFFSNQKNLINNNYMTEIYGMRYSQASNTPPFKSLQETPAEYIDRYTAYCEEVASIRKKEREDAANKR
tara:strand:- start:7760 stop:8158 length:399 start_codon:yes stop_codon:yes gene_type:complete